MSEKEIKIQTNTIFYLLLVVKTLVKTLNSKIYKKTLVEPSFLVQKIFLKKDPKSFNHEIIVVYNF